MEASSVFTSPSPSPQLTHHFQQTTPPLPFIFPNTSPYLSKYPRFISSLRSRKRNSVFLLRPCALVIDDEILEKSISNEEVPSSSASSSSKGRDIIPKFDKSGRFCSPRAARELALSILYASCIEGSDPVRHFEKRLNARKEPGFELDEAYLNEYNPMSFGGPPVTVETTEEADGLQQQDDKESLIEEEVLAAPPKLVYSKLILLFTRKLLVAVVEEWDSHVLAIDKIAPPNWKHEAAGRILEFSILHLAMSEIAVLGTRHQIVINEAIDLAKRFCDGGAPRVINGCLRTFVNDIRRGNVD